MSHDLDDNAPTAELRAWEAWADAVKPGDRCTCAGRPATVTSVTPGFLFARLDGRDMPEPWEWEDVGPVRP